MFKIIPLPDNKGSVYSPFIIAALILITFSVSAYFIEDAAGGHGSIEAAGRIRKASSDMEEVRSEARTMALFSLRRALFSKGNKTVAELEDDLAADMDSRVRSMGGVSSVAGNYSFSVKNLSGGRFLIESKVSPSACLNRSEVVVCSDLPIAKVIEERWIS